MATTDAPTLYTSLNNIDYNRVLNEMHDLIDGLHPDQVDAMLSSLASAARIDFWSVSREDQLEELESNVKTSPTVEIDLPSFRATEVSDNMREALRLTEEQYGKIWYDRWICANDMTLTVSFADQSQLALCIGSKEDQWVDQRITEALNELGELSTLEDLMDWADYDEAISPLVSEIDPDLKITHLHLAARTSEEG